MHRMTLRRDAGANARFDPEAFDSQIGKEIPLTFKGETVGTAVVVDAVVADDQRSVLLTIESDIELRVIGDGLPW